MMEAAVEPFEAYLHNVQFSAPKLPYLSNITGTWITSEQATSPSYWAQHLRQTVRFAESLQELLRTNHQILIEVGPGQSICTFARQYQNPAMQHVILPLLRNKHDKQTDEEVFCQKLQQLWVHGVPIIWQKLYAGEQRQRVVLPTYPFEHQRYWIEAQQKNTNVTTPSLPTPSVSGLVSLHWKQTMLPQSWQQSSQKPLRSCWLIFADETGIGASLGERLQQANQEVIIVTPGITFAKTHASTYMLNPRQLDTYDALLSTIQQAGKKIETIVHAWSVSADYSGKEIATTFEQQQYMGFYSILTLVQALSKAGITYPVRLFAVSNNVQDVSGDESLEPAKATLLGICKVLAQEYRNIRCQSIDLGSSGTSTLRHNRYVEQLMNEIMQEEREAVVAYRGIHRWVQILETIPQTHGYVSQANRLHQYGVYLITGGLGKLGLVLAKTIAKRVPAILVLINRSPFPERQMWASWLNTHNENDQTSHRIRSVQELERMGSTIIIRQADVADRRQMGVVWDDVLHTYKHIHGVLHAAGNIGEHTFCPIQDTTVQQCEEQFRAKVYGTLVLQELAEKQPLDFCLLQSSLSALLGGLGFAAYAAANACMDMLVHARQRYDSSSWQTISWDGWHFEDDEDAITSTKSIADMPITEEFGQAMLERIVGQPEYIHTLVSRTDILQRLTQWVHREKSEDISDVANTTFTPHTRPSLLNTYVAPTNEMEEHICTIWKNLLGIEAIGIHDNFFDLGGHSLLGTQLITRLRDTFHVDLSLRILFEEPTVASLAMMILQKQMDALDQAQLLQTLKDLEQMTDDEVQALIAVRI